MLATPKDVTGLLSWFADVLGDESIIDVEMKCGRRGRKEWEALCHSCFCWDEAEVLLEELQDCVDWEAA
jgi:hypothetical protein